MKKMFSLVVLAALGIGLFPTQPAQAQYTQSGVTNDIVCRFKYKFADEDWMSGDASGTTRLNAKNTRNKIIDGLESQADSTGTELQVVHLGCRDPWGQN
ncbi:hypothetical protein ACL6C3_21605 [Capilliphycus salinus ALCB114379]|uniref:hypothetical protein n=1 Tax=Capilliphycus salinus TaxID=2768948 RepID=UPI0039A6D737